VRAGDRLAGFQRLARREFAAPGLAGLAAIDEDLDPRTALLGAQADMIGRALIGKVRLHGLDVVHGETGRVRESPLQGPASLLALDGTVQRGQEIGRGEMQAAIRRIGRWRHGRSIGGPHRRGRARLAQKARRRLPRRLDHRRVGAGKTGPAQERQIGALVRRQQALHQTATGQAFHLGKAFQHALARRGHQALILRAGQIALGQAAIIMRRADQPVEIRLDRAPHQSTPLTGMRSGFDWACVATG
jgi:hypothetical protein